MQRRALSTVTGIVDGTGSVGAAIGQFLIGVLSNCSSTDGTCHWTPVFVMIIGCAFVSILCISSIFIKDMASLLKLNGKKERDAF